MATTMGETKPVGNNGTDTASVGGYNEGGAMRRFITPGGHPIDTSQPAFPVFHRKFANPSPLGLLGFAATTFVLSMYNVQARHIATPNVVLGMALGYGGLVQLIAGIEEWACGNTFAATALSSYGGFWFSFATLYIPQFAVAAAYTVPGEFENAVGIYLVSWSIITFIFFIASHAHPPSVGGFLGPSEKAVKAGGAFGILTAAIAAYTALAGLLTRDTSYFLIPVGDLTRK
ncbi:hypothetical protein TREMEDRAFT_64877 [Tremella mesenterica DSM 1558]|uniref:uncharacterized protein n=1 Tax=Tremella mesenterica (strain ATCC 24925 / CBS 8224 / DSM 1558 / NBRC 9311 / NRRL Y-6157 / RJB 2259-6 / UBC 559-6) TaxID=578456 RepID=UPI0003F49AC0|nr:uncharacterized protein TREMEDRAFT_64877 [Tremella mesenterica DSM 1558]EIW67010.1 hypothetical protein TREMEDRAFT_64877 [Tremella mesenterica DSM 1558]